VAFVCLARVLWTFTAAVVAGLGIAAIRGGSCSTNELFWSKEMQANSASLSFSLSHTYTIATYERD